MSSGWALLGLHGGLYEQMLCPFSFLESKMINNERVGFGEKPFLKQTMKSS